MTTRTRRRTVVWAAGAALILVVTLVIVMIMRAENHWNEGETHGIWQVRYNGHGSVTGDETSVTLEPKSAESWDVTHGGLVHTVGQCDSPEFSLTVHTEAAVRHGEPNVWEVGWVLWNFTDDTHFYAVVLKPNGWELSKQDADYPGNQRFLASGSDRTFPIGQDYRVTVEQDGATATVYVDGEELVTYTDDDQPYLQGSIGLYTEDARVRFTDFDLPDCARSTS